MHINLFANFIQIGDFLETRFIQNFPLSQNFTYDCSIADDIDSDCIDSGTELQKKKFRKIKKQVKVRLVPSEMTEKSSSNMLMLMN
jgi:hypothetical protein